MQISRVPLPWMTVYADDVDANACFIAATPWMEAAGVEWARTTFELRCPTGNIQVSPAWQVANTEDSPGSFKQLLSYKTLEDVYYPDDWVDVKSDGTAPTKSNLLIRFGWKVSLTSGSSLACANVAGVVEYRLC